MNDKVAQKINSFTEFFNKASVIGTGVIMIIGAIAYLGFKIETPSDKTTELTEQLSTHVIKSDMIHSAQATSTVEESKHIEHVESLIEGLLRGECIENPRENLARQGLLTKCKELGIER